MNKIDRFTVESFHIALISIHLYIGQTLTKF